MMYTKKKAKQGNKENIIFIHFKFIKTVLYISFKTQGYSK